jgi:hypothetical protein
LHRWIEKATFEYTKQADMTDQEKESIRAALSKVRRFREQQQLREAKKREERLIHTTTNQPWNA